eukprot:269238-Rhodomonas_salina.1
MEGGQTCVGHGFGGLEAAATPPQAHVRGKQQQHHAHHAEGSNATGCSRQCPHRNVSVRTQRGAGGGRRQKGGLRAQRVGRWEGG